MLPDGNERPAIACDRVAHHVGRTSITERPMDAPWTRSRSRTSALCLAISPTPSTSLRASTSVPGGVRRVNSLMSTAGCPCWTSARALRRCMERHPQRLSAPARARMPREPLALCFHGVDELRLLRCARGKARVKRARVAEAAAVHLGHLGVVARVEGSEPPAPARGLRVILVAALARRQDRPDGMELPVLAEQVPVAQRSGVEVPDAHGQTVVRLSALAFGG